MRWTPSVRAPGPPLAFGLASQVGSGQLGASPFFAFCAPHFVRRLWRPECEAVEITAGAG